MKKITVTVAAAIFLVASACDSKPSLLSNPHTTKEREQFAERLNASFPPNPFTGSSAWAFRARGDDRDVLELMIPIQAGEITT